MSWIRRRFGICGRIWYWSDVSPPRVLVCQLLIKDVHASHEENRTAFNWQDPSAPPTPELKGFVPITYSTTDIIPESATDAHDMPDPFPMMSSAHAMELLPPVLPPTWHGSRHPQTHLWQEPTLSRVPQRLPIPPRPLPESPLIYHIKKKKYKKRSVDIIRVEYRYLFLRILIIPYCTAILDVAGGRGSRIARPGRRPVPHIFERYRSPIVILGDNARVHPGSPIRRSKSPTGPSGTLRLPDC